MLTAGSDLMDSRMGTNRSTRPPRPVRPLPLRYTDDRPLPAPTLRDPLHSPGIPVSAPSLRLLFTAKMFFPTGATSESWLACFRPSSTKSSCLCSGLGLPACSPTGIPLYNSHKVPGLGMVCTQFSLAPGYRCVEGRLYGCTTYSSG